MVADRALAAPLAEEATPVAEALVEGLSAVEMPSPGAPELRETSTLASLLGRRAAVLGASPTAASMIAPCLIEATEREGLEGLVEPLRAVCLEGFVAAREELLDEAGAGRAGGAVPVVELAPRCWAVLFRGDQEAEELERIVDELGRRLLDSDARACLVHAGGLREPDRERARQLFAVHATCAMLGVECVFAEVAEPWRDAARDAGLDLEPVRIEPDFASGMRAALFLAGFELRARAGIGDVLRRMVTPRRR